MLAGLLAISSSEIAQDRVSVPASGSAEPTNSPASDWGKPLIGHLANGVRFAILPRQGHEPGVALLMRNEGGFIAERRPGERGLAHLIEHVVFHSPTVGSPDDPDHFTRVGLQLTLPAPHVATTSWRESNYFLSSKTAQTGDLDSILALLREAASDLTFRPDTVDGQRASVLQEMADKKLGNKIYASYIAAVAPGSPNDVIDAQNSDDVSTASIDTIRGLYRRLYRPENMMIVVVGNVKVDDLKALIGKRFGDWAPSTATSRPAPFPTFQRDRIRPISFFALAQGRRTALVIDATRPEWCRTLLTYVTITPEVARLHEQFETVRGWAAALVRTFRVPAILIQHAPHQNGAHDRDHIHVLICPRQMAAGGPGGPLGLGSFVPELAGDSSRAYFVATYDAHVAAASD